MPDGKRLLSCWKPPKIYLVNEGRFNLAVAEHVKVALKCDVVILCVPYLVIITWSEEPPQGVRTQRHAVQRELCVR